MLSFLTRRLLDRTSSRKAFNDSCDEGLGDFGVAQLTTPESHHHLDPVAGCQELVDVTNLDGEIAGSDGGANLNLLEFGSMLRPALCVFFFLKLEPILPKIDHTADGRCGVGLDFDQVQSGFFGHEKGLKTGKNPQLVATRVDHTDFGGRDGLVAAQGTRGGGCDGPSPAVKGEDPP